jgi:hypothetical protein
MPRHSAVSTFNVTFCANTPSDESGVIVFILVDRI